MFAPRALPLALVLSLAACGAAVTREGSSPDASPSGDAPASALVVPGSALPPSVRALLLRGPSPTRPGVYVFGEVGAPDDAPAHQLAVVEEEEARGRGERSVFAPSITDARRWERRVAR